jgi:serine/threonine protein kinase
MRISENMNNNKEKPSISLLNLDKNFETKCLIDSGGCSNVFLVMNKLTQEYLAMKTEKKCSKARYLSKEVYIFKHLPHSRFFPKLIQSGKTHNYRYLIQELHGPSIHALKKQMINLKLNLYSTLHISLEMLKCIEAFHKAGFIHRDIKPSNFLLHSSLENSVCLIDFGISASYIDHKTREHIPYSEVKEFLGTEYYSSINAHKGIRLSRRDDLISWIYVTVDMVDGMLPWSGKSDIKVIGKMKNKIAPKSLCSSLPSIFTSISTYILNFK